jgi:pyridoxine/pyridoxamine 5'-phosphate oxidase
MIATMAQNSDPIAKFIRWFDDSRRAGIPNYEAMALATAHGGKTSVRFVLLKGIDDREFVFFTDARGRKGRELRGNPHASLAIYWQPKGRQIRLEGRVEEVRPRRPTPMADPATAEPTCRERVASECPPSLARETSRQVHASRQEV